MSAEQWEQTVRPGLRGMARAVYAPATLLTSTTDLVTFSLPNTVHREKCEQHRSAVETAIRSVTGRQTEVALIVEGEDGAGAAPSISVSRRRSGRLRRSPPHVSPEGAGTPSATVPATVRPGAVDDDEPAAAADPPVPAPVPSAVAPVVAPIDDPIDDDDVDLDDLVDVPPESVKSPIDRLAEAFPGSELIDERS